MPDIEWTEASLRDLRAIDSYLDEHAPDVAVRIIEAVARACDRLGQHPMIGPAIGRGLRSLRLRGTPYLLVYAVAVDCVSIVRVRHDREDWRDPA